MAEPRIWELGYSVRITVVVLVASAHGVREDAPAWLRWAVAGGGGALSGVELLGKLNVGATVLFMTLLDPMAGRPVWVDCRG